ncbi:MAG: GNAT family N-acetyltransferase [Chitinophagaceae bacterium]
MLAKINTDRLTLDLVTINDHAFMRELVNSKGWLEFIGDRKVHSIEDAVAYIEKIRNTPNFFYWVVREKDTNTPVGIISFLKRVYLEHFDIGFAFLPAWQGKGYAYEAANEVLSVAKQLPEYPVILATTIPGNVDSIRLLKKLGLFFFKEIEVEKTNLHIYSTAVTNG